MQTGKEKVSLQVCAQARRLDAWSVFKSLCHKHAWGLERDTEGDYVPLSSWGIIPACIEEFSCCPAGVAQWLSINL